MSAAHELAAATRCGSALRAGQLEHAALRSTPTTGTPASAVGTAMRPLPTPISSTGPPLSTARST